jgi:hypothetical protein
VRRSPRQDPTGNIVIACAAEPGAIYQSLEKNMNAKQLIAGLAVLAAAGSAFAVTPYPPETPFVSTKSRADVQAEVAQAQKDGTLNQARSQYPTVAAAGKPVTRAEVVSQISNTEPSVYNGN